MDTAITSRATDLGLFFPFYSNVLRHSAIPLYSTRQEAIVALVSGDCDASVALCFFAILLFTDQVANAGV